MAITHFQVEIPYNTVAELQAILAHITKLGGTNDGMTKFGNQRYAVAHLPISERAPFVAHLKGKN